ncbi:hypothetical protein [Oribacterium sp. P6A1]|uniref:hypothetical protein n=1 Tax=Oribacterium sp. P6A1 TaxID=1410612 RepID=UPI000568C6B0|nr:hypothetical protein [Oribacterium sp. P6A1]
MSYDISLNERISGETIMLPIKHTMIGGTYRADYDEKTNTFSAVAIRDATLNITYNYGHYYYEAAEGDERFYGEEEWCKEEDVHNLGIRGIYGKTGLESIQMLKDLVSRIESKYKKDGEWITTRRSITIFRDKDGVERHPIELLRDKQEYTKEETEIDVNEGPNSDYWTDTAANAIKPLYQLLVFAELRPDGVWDGD